MTSLYEPLSENEIRLLTISSHDGVTASLELKTYSGNDAPEYDAVSYTTWGHRLPTAPVRCNGFHLEITMALVAALPYLDQSRPGDRRPLWIDAICLNQEDEEEKRIQVARMHEIYANAARTLVWLGEAANNSDLAMENLASMTANIRTINLNEFQYSVATREHLPAYGLPAFSDPVWEALQALFSRPWFFRLWTVQEIVLSRHPVLLCGTRSNRWEDLPLFNREASELGLNSLFLRNEDPESPMGGPSAYINQIHNLRRGKMMIAAMELPPEMAPYRPTGLDLPGVIRLTMHRAYEQQVDRFWAILGILNNSIQDKLRHLIDYSTAAKLNYHTSYLAVMKAQVEDDPYQAIQLLANGLSQAKNSALPSWCADWSLEQLCLPVSNMDGVAAGRPDGLAAEDGSIDISRTLYQPVMTLNGDALSVLGLSLNIVQDVSCEAGRFWVSYVRPFEEGQDEVHERTYDGLRILQSLAWAEECLLIHTGETTAAERKADWDEIKEQPMPLEQECINLLRELEPRRQKLKEILFPGNDAADHSLLVAWCNGRTFFRTREGNFGLGPPDLREGDLVCVLFGGTPLFVLRPLVVRSFETQDRDGNMQPNPEEAFKVVGDAYMPHIMNGKAFQGTSTRMFKLI